MAFDHGYLNEEQIKAVEKTDGPVLIIAGPGTGKTSTLVARTVYLITEKHIDPAKIMVATFTEKAAKEIVTRITNELLKINVSVNLNELYIGTLHSICLRLIEENLEYTRLKKNYRVLDDFEQKYLIFQRAKEFEAIPDLELLCKKEAGHWGLAETLSRYFNAISEELVSYEDLARDSDPTLRVLAEAYRTYLALLDGENCLDFSAIQTVAHRLLQENKDICEKVQEEIQYVMIDEYQDTNYVQEQIIFTIAAKHRNLCVVGDDDQGLYRFRGATIRNILEFPDKWTGCAQFRLVENYRSEKGIVDFYNDWMDDTQGNFVWDKYRYPKKIVPVKKKFLEGVPTVLRVGGPTKEIWCERVLELIDRLRDSHAITDLNQIAFLFRSVKHEGAQELAQFLEAHHVPVYSPRSDLYFEREEIKWAIGALLALFPDYLTELPNNPYIGDALRNYYKDCFILFTHKISALSDRRILPWLRERAEKHSHPIGSFNYAYTALFYEVLQFEPFHSIMATEISGVTDSRAVRNLAMFTNLMTRFEYLHGISVLTSNNVGFATSMLFGNYFRFLKMGGIGEYEDESEYAPSGCVSFMTIHQSKGMEFPVTIVGSLYALPQKGPNADLFHEMEERIYHRKPFEPYRSLKFFDFWRLYYTAFSRAQNLLVLTANERSGRGSEPSKYFKKCYGALPDPRDINIDYSRYTFEKVKEVNIKPSYSFTSDISVYENCALQYKYYKELGFSPVRQGSMMFGTLVHATIEDIHRAAIRGEYGAITQENIERWFSENYKNLALKEHNYLTQSVRETALEQVLRYAERRKVDWHRIKETEVDVSYVEEEYILEGKVDLIEGEDGSVEIVDFKSEHKPDLFTEASRIERYKRQLQIYAYIVSHKTGYPVSKMRLYYTAETDGDPYISFNNDPAEIRSTIDGFSAVVSKIKHRDFSGSAASAKICQNCDLRHYCKKVDANP